MNSALLLEHYARIADAPDAIARLRRFVLDLAVRGKLVEQNAHDEPASELLERITAEKERLVQSGELRKPKAVPGLADFPYPLPDSWVWAQIAQIGIINPRVDADDDMLASFVPMTLISAEYGIPNGHEPRPWGQIKKGYTHFAEGDVALAKVTPCFENGKSTIFQNLTGGMGSGTTELHVVRPLFVDPAYVLVFWKCPFFIKNGIPRMTGTAGQKRVPTEYFANSPFPLPPLAEQHRIVAKVDELMALCDQLEAARAEREAARDTFTLSTLAKLNTPDPETFGEDARFALANLAPLTTRPDQIKQLRQTILNLAVRGKLVEQDAADEPASALLERTNDDIERYCSANRVARAKPKPLMDDAVPFGLPTGWSWGRLCQLFRVITDGDHQPPPRADEGVAFLTIGNVTTGKLNFDGCRLVPDSYFRALPAYRTPSKGDILYTVVGATYGRPALVDSDREFCVQRHIAILKPSQTLELGFLLLLLASPHVYEQASSSTTGAAQPTIALRPLRNFVVPVPPLAEQQRIVTKVDELMALCDQLEASLTTGEQVRSRLLESVLHHALEPA